MFTVLCLGQCPVVSPGSKAEDTDIPPRCHGVIVDSTVLHYLPLQCSPCPPVTETMVLEVAPVTVQVIQVKISSLGTEVKGMGRTDPMDTKLPRHITNACPGPLVGWTTAISFTSVHYILSSM